MKNNLI